MKIAATVEQLEEEAEKVAYALRERFPESPAALHVVAMMNSHLRRTEEAEKLWQKCIEMQPDHVGHYVNLAAIAMDRGNSKLAAETLQQALDAGCSSPDVYHHLAVALTNLGQCERAIEVIQRALDAYPNAAAHWMVLGQAQLKLGKVAEAQASLEKAVSLGTYSADVFFALANACARQGNQEEAAKYREKFSELKTGSGLESKERYQVLSEQEARSTAVSVLCEAAMVYTFEQSTLDAEQLLLRAIALEPYYPVSSHALATLYQQAGMPAEELVVRRRILEIEPHRFESYLYLAKTYERLDQPESVVATLKLAISTRPDAAVGFASLAEFFLQTGKARQARWFAQEAVRRAPTADGYILLASTCRLLGDTANAEAAMARARELDPNNPNLK
jgi:tetratricopeptide (TPR) repeat protein